VDLGVNVEILFDSIVSVQRCVIVAVMEIEMNCGVVDPLTLMFTQPQVLKLNLYEIWHFFRSFSEPAPAPLTTLI
jgi:hypothetical protein